jgi:hypothetical protein
MHRWIVRVMMLAFSVAQPVAAQTRDAFTLDLTVGHSVVSGGRRQYYSPNDVSGEVTLGYRLHPDHSVAPIAALTVGRRSPAELGHGDGRCIVFLDQPGPGCAPHFPAFGHVGLLGGLELRASNMALRALAGPAIYGAGAESGFGGQFHIDGAIGFTHLAIVVAVRQSVFKSDDDGTIRSRSWELGFRIQ